MNIVRRIYCRSYQAAFRLVLPFMPYRRPKLITGTDNLCAILKKKKVKNVLLVTGSTVRGIGLTKPLEANLKEKGIGCFVYDKTVANPTVSNVEQARKIYIKNHCDAIIGFGGGSPMDCAKVVGARIAKSNLSVRKMKGLLKIRKKLPLLVAIPTTAGSGSETTVAAVITDEAAHHKYAISDFCLIPDYAVMDAKTTVSLAPHITAETGMDALTHAVEAFIGKSLTAQSEKDAINAVKLIFKYLPTAYHNGDNLKARHMMLKASYMAGNAFTRSYVGYVHAIAHSLGGKYNIPHGLANAVLLPYVLEAYGKSAHKKLHRLAVEIGISTVSESDKIGAEKFISAVKDMQKDLGIPTFLKGIVEQDIPLLAEQADKEANPLYPVPKLMNKYELMQFYYDVMEEMPF